MLASRLMLSAALAGGALFAFGCEQNRASSSTGHTHSHSQPDMSHRTEPTSPAGLDGGTGTGNRTGTSSGAGMDTSAPRTGTGTGAAGQTGNPSNMGPVRGEGGSTR